MRRMQILVAILLTLIVSVTATALILTRYEELKPKAWAVTVFDARVMSGDAPLPLPTLRTLTAGARDDDEAAAMVVAYYEEQREALSIWFNETTNEPRLRALYGMYLVHLAAPYGVVSEPPNTLLEFINLTTAHCGNQPIAQAMLYDALGLDWRIISVDDGMHGYAEVRIADQYESFDATTNVWVSRSAEELIAGMRREYRMFYTPILDVHADEVWRDHMADGWDVLGLRLGLPQWGISVFPTHWIVTATPPDERRF